MTRSALPPQTKEFEVSYWMVDIPAKTVRVFRLEQGKKYQEIRYAKGSIAVQAFPDIIVELKELF